MYLLAEEGPCSSSERNRTAQADADTHKFKFKRLQEKYTAQQYSDSSQLSRCKPLWSVTLTPNISASRPLSLLSHSLNPSA